MANPQLNLLSLPVGAACTGSFDWGPVTIDHSRPRYVGAAGYPNNTGELIAIILAVFKWILRQSTPLMH